MARRDHTGNVHGTSAIGDSPAVIDDETHSHPDYPPSNAL
jgi:hypothetical protein